MDPVTLYHRDGTPVKVRSAVERTNLLASGYSTEKPFDPAEHTATEVVTHLQENPEDTAAVVAKERAGKNRSTAVPPASDSTGAASTESS